MINHQNQWHLSRRSALRAVSGSHAGSDVPLYLHPDNAYEKPHVLRGCPELDKATWEWTTESASHALRRVVSGVFDRYPRLRIILGHTGETLPYMFWRLDSR
jgi:2,3-dihydroxybenzoate decarboxylase